ncbi:MAG: GNAT family N-acetyltransferase [Lachnospiraceae bacterium]|nr:GNAT family N-acetyltransferase [Lachnospiraceae bacterium]
MRIIYNDLCIRNAVETDCEQLATWWNDGRVMAHAGFPNGLGTTAAKIKEQITNDSDDLKRRLIIEYRGVSIGEMNFCVCESKKVEIGIKICNTDFQEKGLGRVILSMLIEELFSMGHELIFLDTNLKNTRAQHVYEMLGFKKIAINENSWINQLGEPQTSIDYELKASDFCNAKLIG